MEQYSVKAILSAVDKNFTSTLSKANSSLGRISDSSKSALSSISNIAAGLGVFKALSSATNMLTSSIDGAIDRYDTLNKYPKVLKNLGYSTEEANDSTKKLKEGIQGLPTALDEVTSVAQRITILTGNLQKGTDTALALNNALLASSASTSDVSRGMEQYIQMLSKGEVDMQSWRTLQETMSYALSETAKELGIASGNSLELYDAIDDGTITFDKFNEALIECSTRTGGFADMALTASAGIKTSFTNIQTALKSGIEGTIAAIDTMLESSGLPKIQEMLDQIKVSINQIFGSYTVLDDGTKQFNSGLMQAIGNYGDLSKVAKEFAGVLGGTFFIAGTFDYLDLAGRSLERTSKKATDFGNSIKSLGEKFKQNNIDKQLQKIAGESDTTVKKLKSGIAKASRAYQDEGMSMADAMKKAYDDIGVSTDFSVSSITSKFTKITDGLKNMVPSSLKSKVSDLGDTLNSTMTLGKSKINSVGDSIGQMSFKFSTMTGRFSSDAPKAWKVFDGLSNKIHSVLPSIDKLSSGISTGLKKGADAGLKSMTYMAKGLNTIFLTALKVVGPTAILGLVVAGIGLVDQEFGKQINSMLNKAVRAGPGIIQSIVDGIASQVPHLANMGSVLISRFLEVIGKLLPTVASGGVKILESIVRGITQNMNILLEGVGKLISGLSTAIINALPQIMILGLSILLSLVQGILNNMSAITTGINTMVENIKTAITTYLPQMIQMGCQILLGIAQGIVQSLPQIITGAIEILTTLVNTISGNLDQIINTAVSIIETLVSGLISNLPNIISAAVELIGALVRGIINNLPEIISAAFQIITSMVSGLIKGIPDIVGSIGKVMKELINTVKEIDWIDIGKNIILGIADGIKNFAGSLWDAAKSAVGGLKDKVLGFLGIHSPSKWGVWVGKMIDTGMGNGLVKFVSKMTNGAQKALNEVKSVFDNVQNMFNSEYAFAGIPGNMNISYAVDINDDEIKKVGADINNNNEYTINVPLNVDGKEFAHATAKYTDEELKKQEKINNMIKGVK